MFSFLSKLFTRKNNNFKAKQNAYFKRLELLGLEERITPSITVTTTADTGPGSLRQAIIDANTTPGDDSIDFNLTGTAPYTITLSSTLPVILDANDPVTGGGTVGTLTITGLGATNLTISGSDPANPNNANRDFRIFDINTGGDLSISGVTISGAQLKSGDGGVFYNSGSLNIYNSVITGNSAVNSSGSGGGGAIYNKGSLYFYYVNLNSNTSNLNGGAVFNSSSGTLNVNNSIISNNSPGLDGGAIFNSGILNVYRGSNLYNNSATYGGAIFNSFSGTLNVNGSTISGNTANNNGGAIANYGTLNVNDSTLSGNDATTGSGGGIYSSIISSSKTFTISNSSISGNTSGSSGGGIFNYNSGSNTTTITNSSISGNSASGANGGGIYNSRGVLAIINSTLSGNTGLYGGAIYNIDRLTVSNSTIFGNGHSTTTPDTAKGGGIYNAGTATVFNSTISANSATSKGGGIYNQTTCNLTIINSTIANNSATNTGDGIYNAGTIDIANTIIANSNGTVNVYDDNGSGTIAPITGSTAANNLVTQQGGISGWATYKTYADIDLGPLQNNGGPPSSTDGIATYTIALGSNSAAIGTGSATISNAPPVSGTDQRGFSRITNDIGAYAVSNVIKVTTTADTVDPADNLTSLREA
ncbi:MAG: hypothetical protein EBQ87_00180, partial [Planctomycetes bacterium]|nr:hypothetical protein [Planctomycetota bacterium]